MNGPFDSMFDFNGNGMLDPIEEAMLIDFLDDMQRENTPEEYGDADEDDDEYDDSDFD